MFLIYINLKVHFYKKIGHNVLFNQDQSQKNFKALCKKQKRIS